MRRVLDSFKLGVRTMDWKDKLVENLDSRVGKTTRRKVMQKLENLAADANSSETAQWTIGVVNKLDKVVDEETGKKILLACSHEYPKTQILELRKKYKESGDIDAFIQMLHKEPERGMYCWRARYGYPFRKGSVIIEGKIPFDRVKYEQAKDATEKRYHYCHCSMVKEMIKNPKMKISPTFCYCGAGWYKQFWEGILEKPVKIEVLKSVLQGDDWCEFAVHIPTEMVKTEKDVIRFLSDKTKFERNVLVATFKIPKGKVSTYRRIAEKIGKPNAYRAVANALHKNPLFPVVPCHRVVKSDGTFGGERQAANSRRKHLEQEGIPIKKGKVMINDEILF